MNVKLLAAPLGALALSAAVFAAEEVNVAPGYTLAGPGRAAHGFDVVAYFTEGAPRTGSDRFVHVYETATYSFASQKNLDAFKANPAKYAPAYGGFCALGVALGKKLDGDPLAWEIDNGRLLLFVNTDIEAKWNEQAQVNRVTADKKWPAIRSTMASKL